MTELQVVDLGNFPVDEATPVVSGPRGQAGTDGASAYEVAVANGFVGTEAEWLASLKGADGVGGGGGGAVDSVNGQVGVVVLEAADVGARPDTYVPAWDEVTGKPAIPDSADDIGAETPAGAQAKVDTHAADTTAVHGIADTAALATTADVSSASTADRARGNHTGTQSADTLTDGTTNKAFTATERTKLAGVATGATANDTDANLKNRANHTGTQAASTITGLGTAATKDTGTASGNVPLLGTGGRLAIAQIASGTPDGTKFVRDDGALATPAGASGITQQYLGNNNTGTTWTNFVGNRVYLKKITVAQACILTDIEAYIDLGAGAGQVDSFSVALFSDNTGMVGDLLQVFYQPAASTFMSSQTARWHGRPIGRWVTAADYWIAVALLGEGPTPGTRLAIANATGTDRTYDSAGAWFADGRQGTASGYPDSSAGVSWAIRANSVR